MPKLKTIDWIIIMLGLMFIAVPYKIEEMPVRTFGIFIECFMGLFLLTEWLGEKWEKRHEGKFKNKVY